MARTVYNNRGDVLLAAGMTLTATYINKLAKQGVTHIYVEDENLPAPPLHDRTKEKNTAGEVKEVVARDTRLAAVHHVREILLKSGESGKLVIDPEPLYATVAEFTDQLLDNDKLVYNLVDLRAQDDYTFEHSVNVCVLALMTGITMGYDREQLGILGVGALLHDLGKIKVPLEILNKPGTLTPEEFAILKEHPVHGCRMISEARVLGDIPAIIAYQHHELVNGTGYPQAITGCQFHELAQVTAIADKYDALTATRVYKAAFPAHEAYEMCASSAGLWFDERVVKAFIKNIAAYPPGVRVLLSNQMTAVVLKTPRGWTVSPEVRVIADENHRPLSEPFDIDLRTRPDLHIAMVLSDTEYHRDQGFI